MTGIIKGPIRSILVPFLFMRFILLPVAYPSKHIYNSSPHSSVNTDHYFPEEKRSSHVNAVQG